jgi:hypothetical protein
MRFQLCLRPDTLHRRFANAFCFRQFAAAPVGAAIRQSLLHAAHSSSLHGWSYDARTAPLVLRAGAFHAMLRKTFAPAGDG